jgi:hypothetical protein
MNLSFCPFFLSRAKWLEENSIRFDSINNSRALNKHRNYYLALLDNNSN